MNDALRAAGGTTSRRAGLWAPEGEARRRGHSRDPKVAAQRTHAGPRGAMVCVALMLTVGSSADEQTVIIAGGADLSGHTYSWQVTNGGTSPVVEVGFPHYRAGLFFAPPNWSIDCTALVNVGVKDEPGVCTARASSASDGIAPGRSATFSMQIASSGAKRGPGEVVVRFADGSQARVGGIELPHREGLGDKYVSLIGLGAVFMIFLVAQAIRRRRRGPAAA